MKTAISIPDQLFRRADTLAGKLKTSRSELYCKALAEFLARHEAAEVTARLDQVHAQTGLRLEPKLAAMQPRPGAREDHW
jgi:predicted transcriptional regulator